MTNQNDEPRNDEPFDNDEPYTGAVGFHRGGVRFPKLRSFLLFFFRIFLVLFLVAGTIITVSQVIGIFAGSSAVVLWGASLQDTAATLAGIAGILSFALIYTIRGGAKAED